MRNVKIVFEDCENVEVEIRRDNTDNAVFYKVFTPGDDYETMLNEAAETYNLLDNCSLYINCDYICEGTIHYLAKVAIMLMELAEV